MGHKILLADDSITIQKVIELTFTDEDFELHTVGNGQKAIDEIRTVKPDIVLCDIIMPEKSGYEVCEHIKTSEDLKHIPVLLLTGAFEPFDQDRAKKAGCDGFLAKPFEPQTLISKVKELLQSPAKPAAVSPAEPAVGATESLAAPPPAPPAPGPAEVSDSTVMMSPEAEPSAGQESATAAGEDFGFQESFAVEAGERELSVEPGDRTVFLGQDEPAPAAPTEETEDIWSEVQGAPPSPPAPEGSAVDEGATVMMSPDAVTGPGISGSGDQPEEVKPFSEAGFGEMAPPGGQEPAATEETPWVIPGPSEEGGAESAEPELTPLGDFGGFDDFTAPKPGAPVPPAPGAPAESPSPPAPPMSASPPTPSEPAGPGEPAQPIPSAQEEEPFAELAPSVPSPEPAQPSQVEPVIEAATPAEPSPPPSPRVDTGQTAAIPGNVAVTADMNELAEQVAKKVMSQLSEKVIQEIAWEVVPDLAEALIQKEIQALKAKIPK
jgi:CheY-like chemotaxis protein